MERDEGMIVTEETPATTVSQKKQRNKKILILDFIQSSKENLMKVHKILISKSDIRNFNVRLLERGG
jgi:hypothetical protein